MTWSDADHAAMQGWPDEPEIEGDHDGKETWVKIKFPILTTMRARVVSDIRSRSTVAIFMSGQASTSRSPAAQLRRLADRVEAMEAERRIPVDGVVEP